MNGVKTLINTLNLKPHPEGGYYREIFRSKIQTDHPEHQEKRALYTCIDFLLTRGQVSLLHRIASDEIWHFYEGGPATLHIFSKSGKKISLTLGSDFNKGHTHQALVSAYDWFGVELQEETSYSFFGCTVIPGFDFADFELLDQKNHHQLISKFPSEREIIQTLSP